MDGRKLADDSTYIERLEKLAVQTKSNPQSRIIEWVSKSEFRLNGITVTATFTYNPEAIEPVVTSNTGQMAPRTQWAP